MGMACSKASIYLEEKNLSLDSTQCFVGGKKSKQTLDFHTSLPECPLRCNFWGTYKPEVKHFKSYRFKWESHALQYRSLKPVIKMIFTTSCQVVPRQNCTKLGHSLNWVSNWWGRDCRKKPQGNLEATKEFKIMIRMSRLVSEGINHIMKPGCH